MDGKNSLPEQHRFYIIKEESQKSRIYEAGVDMLVIEERKENGLDGDMIVFNGLTQTAHAVERRQNGKQIRSFDGSCRKSDIIKLSDK
jgi:hypothetical protein